jgi:hypothetical protein
MYHSPVHRKADELTLKRVEVRNKNALSGLAVKKAERAMALLWSTVICSACFSVAGFIGWYMRVQRFQDLILRSEAEKAFPKRKKPPELDRKSVV